MTRLRFSHGLFSLLVQAQEGYDKGIEGWMSPLILMIVVINPILKVQTGYIWGVSTGDLSSPEEKS